MTTNMRKHAQRTREREQIIRALGEQMQPQMTVAGYSAPMRRQPQQDPQAQQEREVFQAIGVSKSLNESNTLLDRMRNIQVLIAVMLVIITLNVIAADLAVVYLIIKVGQALKAYQESGLGG